MGSRPWASRARPTARSSRSSSTAPPSASAPSTTWPASSCAVRSRTSSRSAQAFAKGEGTWDEIEAKLLNGQKLQGTITAKDVATVLKTKGKEAEFPLFMRIHEIAFEGKAVSSIIDL